MLSNIREVTATLHKDYLKRKEPASLREKVYLAWGRQTLNGLKTILNQHPDDDSALSDALKHFLSDTWAVVNNTSLSYTAIPSFRVTQLLIDVAEYVASTQHGHAIQYLMPGVSVESYRHEYKNLDSIADIKTLLQTHILGKNGLYLLPVELVTELTLSAELTQLNNPYYDYQQHPQEAGFLHIMSSEEGNRLKQHSALTCAVFDKKQAYETLANDTSNLLGQLTQLCRHLAINDAHGGTGTQENAAAGAYQPIFSFFEYLNQLNEEEKDKIPKALYDEIILLQNLSSDPQKNENATENLATCIGTRKSELLNKMRGHELLLSTIALKGEHKSNLLHAAKELFEIARQDLIDAIQSNTYTKGQDHLGINLQLLNTLNVPLSIESLNDLYTIQTFYPEEISNLCDNEKVKQQIITQLATLDNLVIFIIETSSERLKAFLNVMAEDIAAQWLVSSREISALLMSLDNEKNQLVCEALSVQLSNKIKRGDDIYSLLLHMDVEQCRPICKILSENFSSIIQSASDFNSILRALNTLSAEKGDFWYEIMRDKLPSIIKSQLDFKKILNTIRSDQYTDLCEAMKDALPNIITSVHDVNIVLQYRTPEQRVVLCEAMKEVLPNIIKTSQDFKNVSPYLTQKQRTALYESIKTKLPDLIQSAEDLSNMLQYITPEECRNLCESITYKLPAIIQSSANCQIILRSLTPEQHTAVYEVIKDSLLTVIKSMKDLSCLFEYLTPEQCTALCETLKDALPDLIKSSQDFNKVMQHLKPEQRTDLYKKMEGKLSNLIESNIVGTAFKTEFGTVFGDAIEIVIEDNFFSEFEDNHPKNGSSSEQPFDFNMTFLELPFNDVLEYLTQEQRSAVYESMKTKLPSLIKSANDFNKILTYLSQDQRVAVYIAMENELPNLIKSAENFNKILQHLPPEQLTAEYEAMKSQLPNLIKSGMSLNKILEYLTPEQRKAVYELIQNDLPTLIKSANDLNKVLEYLTPDQRVAVYEAIKEELPNFIRPAKDFNPMLDLNKENDFNNIMEYLAQEQRDAVYDSMEKILPSLIKSANDFNSVLQYLTPQQRLALYSSEALKTTLIFALDDIRYDFEEMNQDSRHRPIATFIKSAQDFNKIMQYLCPEYRMRVYNYIKKELPSMIKSASDFNLLLQFLTPKQRSEMYGMMTDKLPNMIKPDRSISVMNGEDGQSMINVNTFNKHFHLDFHKNLNAILQYISPEERTAVYKTIEPIMPEFIKSAHDVEMAGQYLVPEQRAVLSAMINRDCIQTKKRKRVGAITTEEQSAFKHRFFGADANTKNGEQTSSKRKRDEDNETSPVKKNKP